MDTPELWQFTSSHFNEKARWALDFKRVPHVRHSLIPGFHVPVVKRMTGKTHVPVLKLDGTAISDSSRIIEALERAYPDPPLYPGDADERRRAIELEEYYDEELGPYIRRWVFHVILPYPEFLRALFVSHASPVAQLAQRAMSPLIGRVMRRQMDINPASAEIARAKTMAAMDRLASEVTAVGLPGRRSFHGRRSYGGGPAFAAGQTAGVSVQSRRAASGADRENQGIPLDPSGVPMDAADLSAASRRVGRSRGEGECLSEQGGWRQDRDSPTAVAPPVVAGKARGTGPQIDAVETPRRLAAQSSRRPSAVCSPVVPTRSGCRKSPPTPASLIPPFCITSAAARAWSKRWSCGVSRRLQAQFLEGWPSAREPDIEGVLERFYEVASHRGMARMLAWLILTGREPPDNEAGPAEARGRANARGQGSTSAEGRTPLAGAGRVAVRRDRAFYSRARRFLVRPEHPPRNGPRPSADSTRRFRRWLSKVLERMESRRPTSGSWS